MIQLRSATLVRLAGVKYKEPGIVSTYSESLERLIYETLIPNFDVYNWQGWRQKVLWTLEVNDILYANLDYLQKLYKRYTDSRKKWFSPVDSVTMLLKETNLQVTEKDATSCFGMAKMTIYNELEKRRKAIRAIFA